MQQLKGSIWTTNSSAFGSETAQKNSRASKMTLLHDMTSQAMSPLRRTRSETSYSQMLTNKLKQRWKSRRGHFDFFRSFQSQIEVRSRSLVWPKSQAPFSSLQFNNCVHLAQTSYVGVKCPTKSLVFSEIEQKKDTDLQTCGKTEKKDRD